MTRAAVLLIAATLLAISACGDSAKPDTAAHPGGPGGVRTASCTDATGDGGPLDLTKVELLEGGEGLRATFGLAAPLDTASGSAQLSVMASSQDGNTARQLGVKWVDGESNVFVFDIGSAKNEYVQVPPVVAGSSVQVTFPRSAITGLGSTWKWHAAASSEGTDVDACPDAGGDALNPQEQPFPG